MRIIVMESIIESMAGLANYKVRIVVRYGNFEF